MEPSGPHGLTRSLKEVREQGSQKFRSASVLGGGIANAKVLPRPEVRLTGRPVWLERWKLARRQEELRSGRE